MADFISKYNSGLDLENDIASKASQTSVNNIANGTTKTNAQSLQGKPISTTAPTTGQMLIFNGTQWIPTAGDEYGSNASGSYIKKSDGTLIQWYKGEVVVGSTDGFTKGFSIPFMDNLYVCNVTALTTKVIIQPDNVAADYSNFWCYDITGVSTVGKTIRYGYTAIGRWK